MSANSNPEVEPAAFTDSAREAPENGAPARAAPWSNLAPSSLTSAIKGVLEILPNQPDRVLIVSRRQGRLACWPLRLRRPQPVDYVPAIEVPPGLGLFQHKGADLGNAVIVDQFVHFRPLLATSDRPHESEDLLTELNGIFSELSKIDINIAEMQNSIDEKREATRSILAELKHINA